MALIAAYYAGVDGTRWDFGMSEDSRGVVLMSPALVAAVDRSTTGRSTGSGVVVRAQTLPNMSGTLRFLLTSDPSRNVTLGDVVDGFADAWSPWRDGRLFVHDSRGSEWTAPVRLAESWPVTDRSPVTPGLYRLELDLPVWSQEGCWTGREQVMSGASVTVVNRGAFPLYPRVRWSGSGQSVTLPSGVTVPLPSVSVPHFITTDAGDGFRVTDAAGAEATSVWSAMRGRSVAGRVDPGESTTWRMTSGVSLYVTELTDNPWR